MKWAHNSYVMRFLWELNNKACKVLLWYVGKTCVQQMLISPPTHTLYFSLLVKYVGYSNLLNYVTYPTNHKCCKKFQPISTRLIAEMPSVLGILSYHICHSFAPIQENLWSCVMNSNKISPLEENPLFSLGVIDI